MSHRLFTLFFVTTFWALSLESPLFRDFPKKRSKLQDLIQQITSCDKECGGIHPPLLKLQHASEPRAICNDGSRASYYFHNARSKSWVIFAQPGSLCYDPGSCFARNTKYKVLTTSWNIPSNKTGESVLRTDPINSLFWKYNMVDINYCSSDLFLGNTSLRSDVGVYFRGKEILFSIIKDLITFHNMKSDHTIYFVGSSAGGIGVLVNFEEILNMFKDMGFGSLNVRLILDDSWYTEQFNSEFPCYDWPRMPCITNQTLTEAFQAWNVDVKSQCGDKYEKNASWNCIFATNALKGLESVPVFAIQNQYDNYQLIMSKVLPIPTTETSMGVLKRMSSMLDIGKMVRSEISSLPEETSGFFSMACLNHHTLKGDYSNFPVRVNSQSLLSALKCWLRNPDMDRTVEEILGKTQRQRRSAVDSGHDCSYRVEDECDFPQCNSQCVPLNSALGSDRSVWSPDTLLYLSTQVSLELSIYSSDRSAMERLSNLARRVTS